MRTFCVLFLGDYLVHFAHLRNVKFENISGVKQILFVLFVCVCMPIMAESLEINREPEHRRGCTIHLKAEPSIRGTVGRDRRSPVFTPIIASYNAGTIYLVSSMSIENATIVVKDERGDIVCESDAIFLPDKEVVLPLNMGEGNYTLEITYGNICLSGDFEI